MTVAAQTPSIEYVEDGSTTAFPVPFRYDSPQHIAAARRAADGSETELVYGTDYSVSVAIGDAGGTLTATAAAANGTLLVIRRATPRVQPTDYETLGKFTAASHERALDRGALVDQEQDAEIGRAVKVPRGEAGLQLPGQAQRMGALLGFDASGASLAAIAVASLAPGLIGALLPLLDESYRGPPGAPGGNYLSSINVNAKGAVPNVDSAAASDANKAAFEAAALDAETAGVGVLLPSGTHWVDAASGSNPNNSGAIFRVAADNTRLDVVGETGTVIKRRAAATMTPTSALCWMLGRTGADYTFENVIFDGNEANQEYDAGDRYAEEQSSNIKWSALSGQTPKGVSFTRCNLERGRVGDGYHANVTADHTSFNQLWCDDDPVRRVRASISMSRYPNYACILADSEINGFESEPGNTPASGNLLIANTRLHSILDLAGDVAGDTRRMVKALLSNVHCARDPDRAGFPYVSFWRVRGEAVNCHFRGINRFQRCKMTVRGGSIQIVSKDDVPGEAQHIQMWHDQVSEGTVSYEDRLGHFVVFDGVHFDVDAGVTTGYYFQSEQLATIAGQLGEHMVATHLIDCVIETSIDHVFQASRCGDTVLRGGRLTANKSILLAGNAAGYVNRVWLSDMGQWRGALFKFSSGPTEAEFTIDGTFDSAHLQPFSVDTPTVTSATTKWGGDATIIVDADPSTAGASAAGAIRGWPGLKARLRTPAPGVVNEWVYRPAIAGRYGETNQWVPLVLRKPAKNTTANRPVLAANDAGTLFFDTTLAAAGKPIWWTGTAWVDSAGAAA